MDIINSNEKQFLAIRYECECTEQGTQDRRFVSLQSYIISSCNFIVHFQFPLDRCARQQLLIIKNLHYKWNIKLVLTDGRLFCILVIRMRFPFRFLECTGSIEFCSFPNIFWVASIQLLFQIWNIYESVNYLHRRILVRVNTPEKSAQWTLKANFMRLCLLSSEIF